LGTWIFCRGFRDILGEWQAIFAGYYMACTPQPSRMVYEFKSFRLGLRVTISA